MLKNNATWESAYALKECGLTWEEVLKELDYTKSIQNLKRGTKQWALRMGKAWPMKVLKLDHRWSAMYELREQGLTWEEVVEDMNLQSYDLRRLRHGMTQWAKRNYKPYPFKKEYDLYAYKLNCAGMATSDIARLLNIHIESVRTRIKRAIEKGHPEPEPLSVIAYRMRQSGWTPKQIADRWCKGDLNKAYRLVWKGKRHLSLYP